MTMQMKFTGLKYHYILSTCINIYNIVDVQMKQYTDWL